MRRALTSSSLLLIGPRPQRSEAVATSVLFIRQSLSTCSKKWVSRTQAYRISQDVGSSMGRNVRGREEAISRSRGTVTSTIPYWYRALQEGGDSREWIRSSGFTLSIRCCLGTWHNSFHNYLSMFYFVQYLLLIWSSKSVFKKPTVLKLREYHL